jgi:hypothetical protein
LSNVARQRYVVNALRWRGRAIHTRRHLDTATAVAGDHEPCDGLSLPENLVDSVLADGSPQREAWLATLPNMVAEYAERWSLDVGSPYQPGGRCAWVAPVRDLTGRNLALKVAWSHDEAIHEAEGLRAWAGNGTVLLHDHAGGEAADVLLLERCHPGTPLGQARLEPDQDLIVAGLLHRLWQPRSVAAASGRCKRCVTRGRSSSNSASTTRPARSIRACHRTVHAAATKLDNTDVPLTTSRHTTHGGYLRLRYGFHLWPPGGAAGKSRR